jgi:aspartate racemase
MPIVGIIGGMGPLATAELFRRIVISTPATTDQEHIHILIDNDPQIPDRTAAILGHGSDPLRALVRAARRLERAGASFLIMPCNTAHHWLEPLQAEIEISVLDMITLTAQRISEVIPGRRSIGLLSTEGTVAARLYQRALAAYGYDVLLPTDNGQEIITHLIYEIKAGISIGGTQFLPVADALESGDVDGIILGCTELSLLEKESQSEPPLFDPLQILAEEAIRKALDKP